MARRQTGCSFDTVRSIAAELPDVEEGIAWRVPVWRLRGRMLACTASHKSAEPDTLVVLIGFDQRDAMIADDPATYYLKPHYENYPSVLGTAFTDQARCAEGSAQGGVAFRRCVGSEEAPARDDHGVRTATRPTTRIQLTRPLSSRTNSIDCPRSWPSVTTTRSGP